MKIINYCLICLVALAFSATGCEREEFNSEVNLPRHFKPGDISITSGETEAKLEWNASLFARPNATYTIEIGTDSSFATPAIYTQVIDTNSIVITDSILQVMQYYYARVKANQSGSTSESGWVHSSRFRITGEQIFLNVLDADLKDTSVLLKWRPSAGLTTIRITPAGGTATTINLTAGDVAANQKLISGLTPLTSYTAEIFRGTTRKGVISFTTDELNIFHVTLNPGDDIIEAVANANNGDVIGLEPGTYNAMNSSGSYANILVQQKTITLQAKTGNASNTIVNFKEITLKGSGAGIILKGIQFNGTTAAADYFINITGLASDGEAATFTKIVADNIIVKGTNNSLIRGNRGGNNAHKIDSIQLKNSIFADNGSSAGFDYILLDKMEFKSLEILNSTFYNSGRRLISWATNITAPKPTILINYTTVNSIGYGARDYVLIDANANPVDFTMKNSIFANTPKPASSVGNNLLRASSGSSTVAITHSNLFNLNNGNTTAPATLIIPSYVSQANNISVDLGWTGATTTFTLPPPPSPVRTASETGGPIGDPRWW